jgi:hypothetical protein
LGDALSANIEKNRRRRGLLSTLLFFEAIALISITVSLLVGNIGYLPVFAAFDFLVFAPFCTAVSGGAAYGIRRGLERRAPRAGKVLSVLSGVVLAGILWTWRVVDLRFESHDSLLHHLAAWWATIAAHYVISPLGRV